MTCASGLTRAPSPTILAAAHRCSRSDTVLLDSLKEGDQVLAALLGRGWVLVLGTPAPGECHQAAEGVELGGGVGDVLWRAGWLLTEVQPVDPLAEAANPGAPAKF